MKKKNKITFAKAIEDLEQRIRSQKEDAFSIASSVIQNRYDSDPGFHKLIREDGTPAKEINVELVINRTANQITAGFNGTEEDLLNIRKNEFGSGAQAVRPGGMIKSTALDILSAWKGDNKTNDDEQNTV